MTTTTAFRSLQDLLDETPDLVDYLYNDAPGAHSRGRADLTPVRQEFTNWRDEQHSWRESAVLFDQSHHMPEMYVSGPHAKALLSHVAVNSLETIAQGRARQLLGVNDDGHVIGDCILYALEDGVFELVSSMPLLNWIQFQAETGGWNVEIHRDHNTSDNPSKKRRNFRFQLDGPNAEAIFQELTGGDTGSIPFFRTARTTIGGVPVLVLRHSMSGHKGVEISGPFEQTDLFLEAVLAVGARHGLVRAGAKTYYSASFEGGWMAYPLPAIYTGDRTRAYREWLPADGWEGRFQLAGSFRPKRIEDYYVTPYDLGYGHLVRMDHEFIGRDALAEIGKAPQRTRVSLVWNRDDVLRIVGSLLELEELPYKWIEFPVADYGNLMHRDELYAADGSMVGLATKTGYSGNERVLLSLAMVDVAHSEPGEQIEIVWGEPNGGSRKPHVERHRQTRVRATVAPAPYAGTVRTGGNRSV